MGYLALFVLIGLAFSLPPLVSVLSGPPRSRPVLTIDVTTKSPHDVTVTREPDRIVIDVSAASDPER